MRVLVVSHTATVGGGELSLLELVRALPRDVEVVAACPRGELASRLGGCATIPEVELGFGASGAVRGLVSLARAAVRVRRLARGVDVVHANSVRAGLVASLAGAPVVVMVRDCLPASPLGRLVRLVIRRRARVVVANSDYTARRFGGATVVHPPVDVERFASAPPARLEGSPVLGVVAQLTPWKGQADAIRALALVRRTQPEAVLVLVGSAKFATRATRFDNRSYEAELRELARQEGVADAVRFLGERDDVAALISGLDVLLVPSWEEPFGRTVVEALAAGVPVAATSVGGPAEILAAGGGLLVPPRDPARLAEAALALVGRRPVDVPLDRFTPRTHAAAMLAVYDQGRGVRAATPAWRFGHA